MTRKRDYVLIEDYDDLLEKIKTQILSYNSSSDKNIDLVLYK